jgi:hypothetical protein
MADSALSTSGFGFPWRARAIRDVSSVEHEPRICARYSTTHSAVRDCNIRLISDQMSDTVSFGSLTTSWAYYSADSGSTLAICANADDSIIVQGEVEDSSTDVVFIRSIQWFE